MQLGGRSRCDLRKLDSKPETVKLNTSGGGGCLKQAVPFQGFTRVSWGYVRLYEGVKEFKGFLKTSGTILGFLNKDYSLLGSILGPPNFGS